MQQFAILHTRCERINIPIRQLFAPPADVARPSHDAQHLRQPHADQGAPGARAGRQRAPAGGRRRQRPEVARHVPNFVRPPAVRAEVDEGEDVGSAGGRHGCLWTWRRGEGGGRGAAAAGGREGAKFGWQRDSDH